jgi:hypothetical protein
MFVAAILAACPRRQRTSSFPETLTASKQADGRVGRFRYVGCRLLTRTKQRSSPGKCRRLAVHVACTPEVYGNDRFRAPNGSHAKLRGQGPRADKTSGAVAADGRVSSRERAYLRPRAAERVMFDQGGSAALVEADGFSV